MQEENTANEKKKRKQEKNRWRGKQIKVEDKEKWRVGNKSER